MPLGANSYGSVDEVKALTRIFLAGQSSFNTTTRPTLTEVEKFIDRASGVLNLALSNAGFSIPVSQADAKLACDNWVVGRAVAYVRAVYPGSGIGQGTADDTTATLLMDLTQQARDFVEDNEAGLAQIGVGQSADDSNLLIFTGQTAQSDRADPDDTSLEQPHFRRGQFDS